MVRTDQIKSPISSPVLILSEVFFSIFQSTGDCVEDILITGSDYQSASTEESRLSPGVQWTGLDSGDNLNN